MSKSRRQSPVIPWIGGTLIWAYMSILAHTMRWKVEGIENIFNPSQLTHGHVQYCAFRGRAPGSKPPFPSTPSPVS